jgi:hypothetical protein
MVKYKNGKVELEEGEYVVTSSHPAAKDIEVFYMGEKMNVICVIGVL